MKKKFILVAALITVGMNGLVQSIQASEHAYFVNNDCRRMQTLFYSGNQLVKRFGFGHSNRMVLANIDKIVLQFPENKRIVLLGQEANRDLIINVFPQGGGVMDVRIFDTMMGMEQQYYLDLLNNRTDQPIPAGWQIQQ